MTNLENITRNSTRSASIFFLLAMVTTIVACSDSDSGEDRTVPPTVTIAPAETPKPTSTPIPTPIPTPEPTSTPEPTPEPFSLEIVDMMGRTVEIVSRPTRIVSISPTATEMLYVADGTAIARDSSSTFPAEVLELPELGGAYSPSFEAIAAQRADLILIEALTQGRFLEPLSQLGAPVVAVRATSLDDVTMGIKLIGQLIESNETADQAAQEISSRVTSSV